MRRFILACAVALCAVAPASAASADWREDATRDDIRRIERLDAAWTQALEKARGTNGGELRALGGLADPRAGLARPEPTPGAYRCRMVKLGAASGGDVNLFAYGWFRCRVALSPGGDLTLIKTTGSQRQSGHLYPDSRRRLVFLGAVSWGQDGPAVYRRDPDRDQVGVFERIGPQRWRLVLPYPKQESILDILELRR